jgi:hypothetical protein
MKPKCSQNDIYLQFTQRELNALVLLIQTADSDRIAEIDQLCGSQLSWLETYLRLATPSQEKPEPFIVEQKLF